MSVPVLDLRGVAYAYPGGHQALFGVDLHVHPGERVALLGPNGAGKTTLVLHLNGILTPGAGSVTVSGLPVTDANLLEVRRRVGIVFQDPDDQLFMPTVRDDVAFGPANLGLRGDELEARVVEALDLVGVGDLADRAPHHLSFGQRRRVAIATVLAMRPEILVLDEPSSNLDPASRRELAGILRSLDVTVLMVTHDLPYAVELCERVGGALGGHRSSPTARPARCSATRPSWLDTAWSCPSGSRSRVVPMPATVFDPPERFVAGTVGPPGGRTFFLQASGEGRLVSVSLEKVQVSVLADRVNELLDAHAEGTATEPLGGGDTEPLATPIEDEFRVDTLALAWDPARNVLVIECHDQDPEEAEEADETRADPAGRAQPRSGPGLRPTVRCGRLRRPPLLPVLRPAAGPDRPHLPSCQRIPTLTSSTS